MTHRQFLLWEGFEEHESNTPDVTHHYLMGLAQEVYHLHQTVAGVFGASLPNRVLDTYKFRFERRVEAAAAETSDEYPGFGPKRLTKEDVERLTIEMTKAHYKVSLTPPPRRSSGNRRRNRPVDGAPSR